MSAIGELAEKEKVRLLLETEGSTNMATSEEAADLMRMVQSPAIGTNYDPQNSVGLETSPFPEGLSKLPIARIGNVHVKAEGLFGPKHPLDWPAITRTLIDGGYQGCFSLETHRGHSEQNVEWSKKCMEKMRSIVPA